MSPGAALAASDRAADHTLARIVSGLRFLLGITPLDADAWRRPFLAGEVDEPRFHYRELTVDPEVALAQLDQVPVASIQDPSVAALVRAKRDEAILQVCMLGSRGTDAFRVLSLQLFGGVSPELLAAAESILAGLAGRGERPGERLTAPAVLAAAEAEIAHYRALDPGIDLSAEIRADVHGILCEGSTLLISARSTVTTDRLEALLQHEVGTHLVTRVNGMAQPLRLLGTGLAGYDETQEGLAVLAEIAVGGLTASRLRVLAARVVAVDRMLAGAGFRDTYAVLLRHGLRPGTAYTTCMRVYRGGGLTKAACYLRGLLDLLHHVSTNGSLELLFRGKFALRDLPLIEDLDDRGHLGPARILPRHLSDPRASARLHAAAADPLTALIGAA